ncbi:right-handed parallel beta-helix repeat-containing protein [Flammeovirga pacifica]|uniref:Right handed beta helix domain-containing protein n=1 Tax=Flammeovirga pacifica TaxID=915059 RepID=A0A1S1YUD6_FLAPC|nr:right-handed parallel beta-helix repeat-containing protein [Flammeovirga pacifica]OHX64632.1 hypothetical protein NH26_23975 [Flammeovirga pacifica]
MKIKLNKTFQFLFFLILVTSNSIWATNIYIDAHGGNDTNDGESKSAPIKTLAKLSNIQLKANDKVFFANGGEYKGTINLKGLVGKKGKPILLTNYVSKTSPSDKLPHINGKGHDNAILIENAKFIQISNLKISANGGSFTKKKQNGMRCGVLINITEEGSYGFITLSNLRVEDVYLMKEGYKRGDREVFTPNGTQGYGWGIRILARKKGALLEKVVIDNCEVTNVSHTGIKITGTNKNIKDLKLTNNIVFKTGGPGMQMSNVEDGLVAKNSVNYSGNNDDSRKWGRGSGLWTWGCNKVLIEHNEFRNAHGPADSAGCHIDFNCSNVIVQYNISENNAGGFCEILGNNFNCAYRYNVSINDGHRVKKKGVASQEGKIFWLSGFNGKGKERKGPFNSYFYNNTIYVKDGQMAKVAIDRAAKGALIANNIFYIEGESKQVLGDQYKPEVEGELLIENIVFKNNLFLKASNWPLEASIQDEQPIIGDPKFVNKNGRNLLDFAPTNKDLVKGKGIQIIEIPKDKKGLYIGVEVKEDILGNPINGKPDLGAIQYNEQYSQTQK